MVGCLTEPNACFRFKFLVCLEKIKTKNVVSSKKKKIQVEMPTPTVGLLGFAFKDFLSNQKYVK